MDDADDTDDTDEGRRIMGMDPQLLEETLEKMRTVEDRRAVICTCGHTLGSHETVMGRSVCNGRKNNCRCQDPAGVVKVPNARMFLHKSDEKGSAVLKGVARTHEVGMGHRIEWLVELVCLEEGCGSRDRVDFVEVDGGRTMTMKCQAHR